VYSIDWARLRSVIAEKEVRYGGTLTPLAPSASEPAITHSPGPNPADQPVRSLGPAPPFDSNSVGEAVPDPKSVADRGLLAIRKLFRVQGTFARLEGDHLEFLLRTHAYRDLGYSSFRDFVREELQMSSRTATRRVALSRILRESAILSSAVDEERLSPCQALVLEPMMGSNELSEWVQTAAGLTVRELSAALQARESTVEAPDASGRTVTFGAPASAAYVWDHGIELARRVLGWEAPVYRCVEAVLAEAMTDICGEVAKGMSPPSRAASHVSRVPEAPPPEVPESALRWSHQFESLHDSIVTAEEELKFIEDISRTGPESAERSLEFVRGLKRRERSLRILFAQALQDADAARVIGYWGYRSITDLLIRELKVSERTAARYMSEAWTFDGNLALSHAYCSGRIGLGQAYLVNRVASASTLTAFIRRAEVVTHLQFEQEVLFLERLAEYWPTLARRFPGPLPVHMLDLALREGLKELGWSGEDIEERFGNVTADDPASDSTIMGKLESLLECLVLAIEERDIAVRDGVPTLASEKDAGALPTLATEGTTPAMSAVNGETNYSLPMLASDGPRTTTISFWAPEPLIQQWNEAISVVQSRHGPLPTWAAAISILQIAVREWERLDPARRPTEWKILERDRWRCQAPGCSARRGLEVHHIIFRARGGSDAPENLTTLCHAHHHHGIHDEGLHLEGTAPGSLMWRLGKTKWFHGSRRTRGPTTLTGVGGGRIGISEKAEQ
jgi:hypothetical protein